jgi:hypothetical protein
MTDKIEAVSKVNQTQSTDATEKTGLDDFQNFMDSHSSAIQPNFEVVDASKLGISPLDNAHLENQPTHLNEQDVSSNKMGSATDQEQKGRQGSDSQEQDEVEGISGVQGTKGKSSVSGLQDLNRVQGTSSVNIDDLKQQYESSTGKITDIKDQLGQVNQAQAEIKPSYQKLLRNHLSHIDDNLKIVSTKLGVESPAATPAVSSTNPIEKFISMMTRSQQEMKNVRSSLDEIQASGKPMDPGTMLAIQVKTNLISHEIELFSNLLNKALEGIKTVMNIQI